ncbi:unnamed protein product [Hyaloperonospora brassicae]|uniref:Uncharacterized protein n=1 Tax=Hyaloperonospora brassicae TaxID=162125 RepID=A0AAV0T9Y1_HYABA|nr:unnamed protein product [Hyaloperonospora brassicae]
MKSNQDLVTQPDVDRNGLVQGTDVADQTADEERVAISAAHLKSLLRPTRGVVDLNAAAEAFKNIEHLRPVAAEENVGHAMQEHLRISETDAKEIWDLDHPNRAQIAAKLEAKRLKRVAKLEAKRLKRAAKADAGKTKAGEQESKRTFEATGEDEGNVGKE